LETLKALEFRIEKYERIMEARIYLKALQARIEGFESIETHIENFEIIGSPHLRLRKHWKLYKF
jgi:hypothetical protein